MPESVEFGESKMSHRSRKARVANDDETSSSDGDSSDIVVQASCVESRISDGKGRISEENRKRNVPTAGADDSDSDAEYKEEQEQEQKQRRTETITDDEVVPAPEEWDDPEAEPHVIVVGRDYAMHDGANLTRFQRIFPRRLRAAGVRRRKWERTIDQINAYFEEAEALDCPGKFVVPRFTKRRLQLLSWLADWLFVLFVKHSWRDVLVV